MEVVAPLRVDPEPAVLARGDHPRVVEVGLGDQRQRPVQLLRQRCDLRGHLLEQVHVGVIGESVYGVEAQAVEVEVGEPHAHAVEDVAAYLRGALTVQVHRRAPRVGSLGRQVGPEHRQVVPGRAEVVVDDVLDHAQPCCMRGIDEALVRRGPAVLLLDGRPEHAVVPPVVGAVERVDRQQLDEVDAELDEVVEATDGSVEGSLRSERAEVQLVEHRSRELASGPRLRRSTRTHRRRTCATVRVRRAAGGATSGPAAPCPGRPPDSRSRPRPPAPLRPASTSRRRRGSSRRSRRPR